MQKDFENLFYEAEDHYLNVDEMIAFKHQVSSLKQRLTIYKKIRDQEIVIFQSIADDLVNHFPQEQPKRLENSLIYWISVMRYGAMAMLLNNPDYLRYRLLEWLADIIHAQKMVAIETHIFNCLKAQLQELFSVEEMTFLNVFLTETKTILLNEKTITETLIAGEQSDD